MRMYSVFIVIAHQSRTGPDGGDLGQSAGLWCVSLYPELVDWSFIFPAFPPGSLSLPAHALLATSVEDAGDAKVLPTEHVASFVDPP